MKRKTHLQVNGYKTLININKVTKPYIMVIQSHMHGTNIESHWLRPKRNSKSISSSALTSSLTSMEGVAFAPPI